MFWKIILSSNKSETLLEEPKTYSELINTIKEKCNTEAWNNFSVKYLDTENELINLNNQEDFDAAILSCKRDNVRVMKVCVTPNNHNQSPNKSNPRKGSESSYDFIFDTSQRKNRDVKTEPPKDKELPENIQGKFFELFEKKIDHKVKKEVENKLPVIMNILSKNYKVEMPVLNVGKLSQCEGGKVCSNCNQACMEAKSLCKNCFENVRKLSESCKEDEPQNVTSFYRKGKRAKTLANDPIKRNYKKYHKMKTLPANFSLSRRKQNHEKDNNYKVTVENKEIDSLCEVQPSEAFKIGFTFKNSGDIKWPENVYLVCINGLNIGREKLLPSLEPGRQFRVKLAIRAPKETGKYLSQWKVCYGKNREFSIGDYFFQEIRVLDDIPQRKFPSPSESSQSEESQEQLGENHNMSPIRKTSFDLKNNNKNIESEERKLPIALSCKKDRAKCAEYLEEIFPGDFEEKKRFVNRLDRNCSIFDVVGMYLRRLGNSMSQNTYMP